MQIVIWSLETKKMTNTRAFFLPLKLGQFHQWKYEHAQMGWTNTDVDLTLFKWSYRMGPSSYVGLFIIYNPIYI